MFKEHLSDNRGLLVSLALLFLATLGCSAYLVYTLLTLHAFIQRGEEGVAAVLRLEDLYANLLTAESSQRGYIITGTEKYLAPYNDVLQKIPKELAAVKQSGDTLTSNPRLDRLNDLTNERLRQLKYTIDKRHDQSLEQVAATVNFDKGKTTMDEIRALVTQIATSKLGAIVPQEQKASRDLQRSLIITPLLVAFVLAMCVMIMQYFQKAIQKERAIEGSKNEFLSLASHQLRTPATNVKQYIHLVLDGFFGDLTDEQREALEIANKNNDIEISIINDLLNIAKVDLNQIAIAKRPTDTNKLVRQIVKDFKEPAAQRQQTLSYRSAADIDMVPVDPTYFRTVVENLVDNASKYSPTGGRITLRAEIAGDQYRLHVTDEGVGIKKQDLHKLFKKFSRIPNPLSDSVEGSGLGLYWVSRVVELHGGTITVASKSGKGSTFTIAVPRAARNTDDASGAA